VEKTLTYIERKFLETKADKSTKAPLENPLKAMLERETLEKCEGNLMNKWKV
jgi:hypothetical protein